MTDCKILTEQIKVLLDIQQIIFDYDENDIDTNKIILDVKFALKSNTSLTDNLTLDIKN